MSIKILVTNRGKVDLKTFFSHPELERVSNNADLFLTYAGHAPQDLSKTIYVGGEPPTQCRAKYYKQIHEYFLALTMSIPGTVHFANKQSDSIYYPTTADAYPPDRTPRKKGNDISIYFAGRMSPPDSKYGLISLRSPLCTFLKKRYPLSKIEGIGWKGQSTKPQLWRRAKRRVIANSNHPFVLCLENTIHKGYVSEKLWDGLFSNKVTLYLGYPGTIKYLPDNCLVDLHQYYDIPTRKFDYEALANRLETMTEEEYQYIKSQAVIAQEAAKGKHLHLATDCANRLAEAVVAKCLAPS